MLTALATILAAVVTAGATYLGAKNTNKTNRQINESNNAFNAEEAEKTRDWNDIGQQMQRAQDAGVNPVAIAQSQGGLNFGGTSNAQAQASTPLPVTNPFAGISSVMEAVSSGSLDIAKATTENRMRDVEYQSRVAQIDQTKATVANLTANTASVQISNKYLDAVNQAELAQAKSQTHLNYRQSANVDKYTEVADFQLRNTLPAEMVQYADQHKINLLNQEEIVAHIGNIYADTILKGQQGELLNAQTQLTNSQTEGQNLDNLKTAETLDLYLQQYDIAIKTADAQLRLTEKEKKAFWIKTIAGGVKDIGIGVGSAVGGVVGGLAKGATSGLLKNTQSVGQHIDLNTPAFGGLPNGGFKLY